MKRRTTLVLFFVFFSSLTYSQVSEVPVDSTGIPKDKKLAIKLDLVSRYLWRGQCWGGDYVAVQPTIEFEVTPKLTLGFWATTNFKGDYFYPDGATAYKGYQEMDFYAIYQITDFMQFQLWDYYWPSVSKVEGVDNRFFNYGNNGVKTVDATVYFDFSEGYRVPFNATVSTLVAGNDYRYDRLGNNPKQNFTTYIELGYSIKPFSKGRYNYIKGIEVAPLLGAVLNNKAGYYSYADYDKVSVVNMGIKATREFDLGKGITMPMFINYIHNGATRNTQTFGKNFLVVGISIAY